MLATLGCQEPDGQPDADGAVGRDDAEAEPAVDADVAVRDVVGDEADVELEARPGPLTHVTSRIEALPDRLCDLDGDGIGDNALADIGSPYAELFIQLISVSLAAAVDGGDVGLIHFPWIDDLGAPSDEATTIIFGEGEDVESPDDPSNNFSGEEPFYIENNGIDPCGEPRFFEEHALIDDGALSAGPLIFPFVLGGEVPCYTQELDGTIEPLGTQGRYLLCGYIAVGDVGDNMINDGEFSLLELLAGGGEAGGVTPLPGVDLDLDLDGDGLERFILGEDNHIVACVDGDSTIIDGADCWRDERIADGVSINFELETVSARFDGLMPGWEEHVEGDCAEPPEESLWDPPETR